METYFAGTDVTLTMPFLDGAGQPLSEITGASYQVVDAAGEVIVASTNLTVAPGDTQAVITVQAASNMLEAGVARDLRSVILVYTAAGVTRETSVEYMIEGADVLIVGTNSVQTYLQALLSAADLVDIDAWASSDKATRTAALINAFINICNLDFETDGCPIKNLATLTAAQIATLPARFLRALRSAQVVEANDLLDPSSVFKKRQAGLMSETIGESSMMFRPSKVLQQPVSRRSLDLLSDYIDWSIGVGRA